MLWQTILLSQVAVAQQAVPYRHYSHITTILVAVIVAFWGKGLFLNKAKLRNSAADIDPEPKNINYKPKPKTHIRL